MSYGKHKQNYGKCTSLNEDLAYAIECLMFDEIERCYRLLHDAQCRINAKSQKFIGEHHNGKIENWH